MKERQRYTQEEVQRLAEKMRQMPKVDQKKDLTKSEAVKLLIKDIQAMRTRGYTLKDIAELWTSNDFNISESVLKSYMRRSGATSKKAKPAEAVSTKAKSNQTGNTRRSTNVTQDRSTFAVKPDTNKEDL